MWRGRRRCPKPSCTTMNELPIDHLVEWSETQQIPVNECTHCGYQARLSRWNLRAGAAFSHLAISGDVIGSEDELLADLRGDFGGTWAWIYQHI